MRRIRSRRRRRGYVANSRHSVSAWDGDVITERN